MPGKVWLTDGAVDDGDMFALDEEEEDGESDEDVEDESTHHSGRKLDVEQWQLTPYL